ncbi:MAG: hypothetical protein LBI70_03645 [Rickettsiales bacterium]|jgi:hypothetical protein|nr:hypothetical protein [Rickettsiales bacterium]
MQDDIDLKKHEIFEKKVMNMLLAGDHELFARLRRQYETAMVKERDFTGCGFFTGFTMDNKSVPTIYDKRIILGDVFIDYNGQRDAFGTTLFIDDGLISCLEVFHLTVDDWVNDYDKIDDVYYCRFDGSGAKTYERDTQHVKEVIRRNMPSQKWEPKKGPLALTFEPKDDAFLEKHMVFEKQLMDMLFFGETKLFAKLRKQYDSKHHNYKGIYEYIMNDKGQITHERFVENGKITGTVGGGTGGGARK